MSNSSQQQNSSTDLITESLITLSGTGTDTFTIELPSDLYTSSNYINTNMNTVSISGPAYSGVTYTTLTSDTITLNSDYQFSWGDAQEFVDAFPDWQRVQDMCKKYPGLEIALRNFRTVYTLVKDDYDNPKDKT
jgi:hypothetical protein